MVNVPHLGLRSSSVINERVGGYLRRLARRAPLPLRHVLGLFEHQRKCALELARDREELPLAVLEGHAEGAGGRVLALADEAADVRDVLALRSRRWPEQEELLARGRVVGAAVRFLLRVPRLPVHTISLCNLRPPQFV